MKTHQIKIFLSFFLLAILTLSCSSTKRNNEISKEIEHLRTEIDRLNKIQSNNSVDIKTQIATFLTFQKNNSEQAMNFYIGLFDNSEIVDIKRWGEAGPGKEGTIMHATFTVGGKLFMCSDSPPVHEWGFTPAVSNFVECEDESQIDRLFTQLSENGTVMMPLNNYGFSQKFAFVEDKFGVSWQLNLQ